MYLFNKYLNGDVHSCSANWDSPREKFYLLKLSEVLAGCGQPCPRDCLLLGRRSAQKTHRWLGAVVWVPHRDFLRGSWRVAGQGPSVHVQLPCQQRNQVESTVHSHWIQLSRKIRKLHGKRSAGPHPTQLARVGLHRIENSGLNFLWERWTGT